MAREQAAGRLPADLDPALLLLSLLGAALYPVLLPDVCEVMTGSRPDDPEFASAVPGAPARSSPRCWPTAERAGDGRGAAGPR